MNLVTRRSREIEDVPVAEFMAHFNSRGSVLRGDYVGIFDAWRKHFPEAQILVDFYDYIKSDPSALLARICGFLEVEMLCAPKGDLGRIVLPDLTQPFAERGETAPHNYRPRGADIPPALRSPLERMYRADLRRLAHTFGGPARGWQ
jgi:hypothetical protein